MLQQVICWRKIYNEVSHSAADGDRKMMLIFFQSANFARRRADSLTLNLHMSKLHNYDRGTWDKNDFLIEQYFVLLLDSFCSL